MSLFTKSEEPARELTVEETRSQREAELLATIQKLDAQVETLRGLIAAFRVSHLAIVNDTLVFTASDPDSLDTLRSQWSALLSEAGELARKRDAALSAWSELHSNRETVTHGHPW